MITDATLHSQDATQVIQETPAPAEPQTQAQTQEPPQTTQQTRPQQGTPAEQTPVYVTEEKFQEFQNNLISKIQGIIPQQQQQQVQEPTPDQSAIQEQFLRDPVGFFRNDLEAQKNWFKQEMEKRDQAAAGAQAMSWVQTRPDYSMDLENKMAKVIKDYNLTNAGAMNAVKTAYQIVTGKPPDFTPQQQQTDLIKNQVTPPAQGGVDAPNKKTFADFVAELSSLPEAQRDAKMREAHQMLSEGKSVFL